MIGNSKRSPRFIKAKNEEELQKKILLMQLQTHKEYAFLSIYRISGWVIAWYYDDVDYLVDGLKALRGK